MIDAGTTKAANISAHEARNQAAALAAAERRAARAAATTRQLNRLRAILDGTPPLPDMSDRKAMLNYLFGFDRVPA